MRVLLTGATGFLGMEVLARLVERDDDVVAVVRASDAAAAQRRLDATLALVGARGPAVAVPGDLSEGEPPLPAGRFDAVVHCAASISFTLPLDEARAINVDGTRRLVDIARRTGARLVHVSTAYVAGLHGGRFHEDDLDIGQEFRNTYERTKREAELLVEAADDVPSAVARPSIVVGESGTGWTPAFNVLYWPLRAFTRGLLDPVPAAPTGRVDIVPVDYVADGIVALLDADARGTHNLVASDDALTVDELLDVICGHLERPRPTLVDPTDDAGAAGDHAAVYVPYFDVDTVFDATRAHALLGPPPAVPSYFGRLVEYAEAARWGKLEIVRPAPGAAARFRRPADVVRAA
ncbi:MAG TPA: SDR family oxidoreductase [Solirubrobacteraceae bacterium]|nr:SDR family oxidoreductase [Solirubrobacteraceae bacterium]